MSIPRRALAVLLALGAAAPSGCRYAADRALDLTDVLDVKLGRGGGLGVKVEATDYVGIGLGLGTYPWVFETYGRRAETIDMSFFHVLVFGLERSQLALHRQAFTQCYLVQLPDDRPPWIDRFRLGGEVLIPFVAFGAYVNLGELLDLLAGIVTLDPAQDDGVDKGAELFPDLVPPQQPVRPRGRDAPLDPQGRPAQVGLSSG